MKPQCPPDQKLSEAQRREAERAQRRLVSLQTALVIARGQEILGRARAVSSDVRQHLNRLQQQGYLN